MHHDDYNYSEIDQVLDAGTKEFIRACCNQPSAAGASAHGLRAADRLLVSVLVMEARLQSELLFALRAVMKQMS